MIIILSLTFYVLDCVCHYNNLPYFFIYPLFYVPEDVHMSDQNIYEFIAYKNYFTSVYFVGITVLYIYSIKAWFRDRVKLISGFEVWCLSCGGGGRGVHWWKSMQFCFCACVE